MPEGPATGGGAPDQRVRDRQVLYIAVAVVVFVIGLQLVSALVPAVGQVLGFAPVLIGALIVVTIFVLARALRPR